MSSSPEMEIGKNQENQPSTNPHGKYRRGARGPHLMPAIRGANVASFEFASLVCWLFIEERMKREVTWAVCIFYCNERCWSRGKISPGDEETEKMENQGYGR